MRQKATRLKRCKMHVFHIFNVLDSDQFNVFWIDDIGYTHHRYFDTYTDALAFKYDLIAQEKAVK